MITLDVDFTPWRTGLAALRDGLDEALDDAACDGAEAVAHAARADHPYTDRSGTLTRSVRAYAPRGSFSRDTLRVEVVARAPYASHLEDRRDFAFLAPAWERSEGHVGELLERALDRAVRNDGLR
jgi:hypothetical protein